MKAETKDTVTQKIKDLRAFVATEKAEKIGDVKKNKGGRAGAETAEPQDQGESGKAGGHQEARDPPRKVQFWEAPEEFRVDYTEAEDVKEFVVGPDTTWADDVFKPDYTRQGALRSRATRSPGSQHTTLRRCWTKGAFWRLNLLRQVGATPSNGIFRSGKGCWHAQMSSGSTSRCAPLA